MSQTQVCRICSKRKRLSAFYKRSGRQAHNYRKECKKCLCVDSTRLRKLRGGEYFSWQCMRQRCRNPHDPHYRYYGGRGIKVCKRWDSFHKFVADVGKRPSPAFELDRIDPDKGYTPANCRWVTHLDNMRNGRNVRLDHLAALRIQFLRKVCGVPIAEVAAKFGVSKQHVSNIVNGHRW